MLGKQFDNRPRVGNTGGFYYHSIEAAHIAVQAIPKQALQSFLQVWQACAADALLRHHARCDDFWPNSRRIKLNFAHLVDDECAMLKDCFH
jgi:hypothetical protein